MVSLLIAPLSGCGEAVFFENIRIIKHHAEQSPFEVVMFTTAQLGYRKCSNTIEDYCNPTTHHAFTVTSTAESILEIEFESFGVPGRQEKAREEFAIALKKNCPMCMIYIRDHSVWGFRKEDSGWNAF